MKILSVILAMFLVVACVPEKKKLGEGPVTHAPLGHIDLCAREPEHKLCKKQ
jgi:hypothetical protein